MFDVLLNLITAITAVSALVALVTTFKPGVSERAQRAVFGVLAAVTPLAAVGHLMVGHVFYGTLFAAAAAFIALITWDQALRVLVRWVRARKGEK